MIYSYSTKVQTVQTGLSLTAQVTLLPTADGTSGQSIITDGSGNLTFGTAAGTGITAVVQDTTPQLGGDLESNGHDILFADNDKAIFGAGLKTYRFIMMGLMATSAENGTGDLLIGATNFQIRDDSLGEQLLTAIPRQG